MGAGRLGPDVGRHGRSLRPGPELGGSYNDYEVWLARSFGSISTKLAYSDTSGYDDVLAESLGERHLAEGRVWLSVGYEF